MDHAIVSEINAVLEAKGRPAPLPKGRTPASLDVQYARLKAKFEKLEASYDRKSDEAALTRLHNAAWNLHYKTNYKTMAPMHRDTQDLAYRIGTFKNKTQSTTRKVFRVVCGGKSVSYGIYGFNSADKKLRDSSWADALAYFGVKGKVKEPASYEAITSNRGGTNKQREKNTKALYSALQGTSVGSRCKLDTSYVYPR
jgi:hypothetical protein